MIEGLSQLVGGKSAAELNAMADQLVTVADLKAAANKKAAAAKAGGAGVTVAKAGTGVTVAKGSARTI